MLTNIVETKLNSELLPGERLLWSGQPRQGFMLRWRNLMMAPVGLVWGMMGVVFTAGALVERADRPMLLIGLPLSVAALLMVCAPTVADILLRRRTYYGLTDQRLLIVTDLRRRHVRGLNLRTLSEVQYSEGRRGRGTLTFGSAGPFFGALAYGWGRHAPAAFDDIEQPRAVYEQLHAAQARLLAGR